MGFVPSPPGISTLQGLLLGSRRPPGCSSPALSNLHLSKLSIPPLLQAGQGGKKGVGQCILQVVLQLIGCHGRGREGALCCALLHCLVGGARSCRPGADFPSGFLALPFLIASILGGGLLEVSRMLRLRLELCACS